MQTSNVRNECIDDRSPVGHVTLLCMFHFSFCKLWNFCVINRHSTRPDNFVTGVKMFPYVRPRRALRSVALYLHGASYNLLVTSPLAIPCTNSGRNFVTALCMFNYYAA